MTITSRFALFAGIGLAVAGVVYAPHAEAAPQVSIGIGIGIAPPAPLYERAPVPRAGFIWAPGYWNWNGYRYVWFRGRWLARRAGYYYVAPRWQRYGHSWRLHRSYWTYHRPAYRPVYRHGYRHSDGHRYRRGVRHERRVNRHNYQRSHHRGGRHERRVDRRGHRGRHH